MPVGVSLELVILLVVHPKVNPLPSPLSHCPRSLDSRHNGKFEEAEAS